MPDREFKGFVMKPIELIYKIIELYHEARKPSFYHPSIRRGRSHSVAAKAEDLFAQFLALNLKGDYHFLVDQPLRIEKLRPIYPDIAIIKGGIIVDLIDVKMDLGWKRSKFIDLCKKYQKTMKRIAGKNAKAKDGISKKDEIIKVARKVKYHIVIVSDRNISEKMRAVNIKGVKGLNSVKVYYLSGKAHPNEYGMTVEQVQSEMDIYFEEFSKLLKNLKSN